MHAPAERRSPDWPIHLAVFAAMTGLSVYLLLSLVQHLKGTLPSWYFDTWVDTWTVWWMRQALWVHPHNPFMVPLVEYPLGADMYWNNLEIAKSAWGVILVPLIGQVTTHNVLIWTTFPLAGYTAWLFVRYMLEREGVTRPIASAAAFAGACAFTFSRYHFCHAEAHLNLTAVEGIPLYLFFFMRYMDHARRRDLVYLLLAIVYTAFCDSYYLVYSAVISFFWVVAESLRQGPLFRLSTLFTPIAKRAATVALAVTVVLSPWITVLLLHAFPPPVSPYHGDADYVADVFNYFVPDRTSYWLPKFPQAWQDISNRTDGDNEENGYFIGYLTPLLCLIAARRPFMKSGTRWFVYAVFFISLTFGFEMRVATAMDAPIWIPMAAVAFFLATLPGGLRAGPRRDAWIAIGLAAIGCYVIPVTANGAPYRTHLTMPYAVFKTIVPMFARGGMPDRFVLCADVSISVLLGGFAAWVGTLVARTYKWLGVLVALLFAAIPCVEYRPRPMIMTPVPVNPPVFEEIHKEPPEIAVFTDGSPMSQYEQTFYEHPISYVRMARVPRSIETFERPKRVYQVLHHERTLDEPVSEMERNDMREFLSNYHFRYYVTHFWDDARDQFVVQQLGGRLLYRAPDNQLIVYRFDAVH
jgi:hypothetical protein